MYFLGVESSVSLNDSSGISEDRCLDTLCCSEVESSVDLWKREKHTIEDGINSSFIIDIREKMEQK